MWTRSLIPARDKPKMCTRRCRHSNRQRRGLCTVMSRVCLGILFCGLLYAPWVSAQVPDAPSNVTTSAAATEQLAVPLAAENPIPTKSLLQVIRDGGPLMLPIAFCSFVLLVFVFERAISLRRGRVIPGPFVRKFIEQLRTKQLDREMALERCEKNRSPVSDVFAAAINKWGRPAVEIEQAIIDEGERMTHGLRKYIRLFNGISTICPLLGLLGTVLGMIRAFNSIATADAMGRPELLAAGISQALLTTAAGLTVAIPALIAYLFFVGRVDRLIIDIDTLGQKVVGLISAETRNRETDPKTKSRTKAA